MHKPKTETCAICSRRVPAELITLHHLTPKQKGGKAEHCVPMCKTCHKQIHATFHNTDLAKLFDTVESLRQAPQLQPFLKWIRKQKADRTFRTRMSKEHPHHGRRK